jgi:hypothetical protein
MFSVCRNAPGCEREEEPVMSSRISGLQRPAASRLAPWLCVAMSCLLLAGARPEPAQTSRLQEVARRMAASGVRNALYTYTGRRQPLQPAHLGPGAHHGALRT